MPFLSFALRIKLRILNYVSGLWGMALISSVSPSCILYDLPHSSHLIALSFAIHSEWNTLLLPALVPGPTPAKTASFHLLRQFMCYFLHVDLQWSLYYELGTLPIIIIANFLIIYYMSSTVLSTLCKFLILIINLIKEVLLFSLFYRWGNSGIKKWFVYNATASKWSS